MTPPAHSPEPKSPQGGPPVETPANRPRRWQVVLAWIIPLFGLLAIYFFWQMQLYLAGGCFLLIAILAIIAGQPYSVLLFLAGCAPIALGAYLEQTSLPWLASICFTAAAIMVVAVIELMTLKRLMKNPEFKAMGPMERRWVLKENDILHRLVKTRK